MNRKVGRRALLRLLITLTVTSATVMSAAAWLVDAVTAQQESAGWTEPVNLSQSGSADGPMITADGTGRYHVLWLDAFDGLTYAGRSGENWTAGSPVPAMPFAEAAVTTGRLPVIVAGSGVAHAFWVESSGADGPSQLRYSSVSTGQFALPGSWSAALTVAEGVLALSATVDAAGRLHLATIESAAEFGGLYYQEVLRDGSLTRRQLVYESIYLRLASGGEANVQIAAGQADEVFIAWDNPAREEVLLARSANAGGTWEPVRTVDERVEADSLTSAGPKRIRQAVHASDVHVVWQAGHEGAECTLYHQLSRDLGETWEPVRPAFAGGGGCSDLTRLFVTAFAPMMLLGNETEMSLTAWNGTSWSEPEAQPELTGFTDTEIMRTVSFTCGRAFANTGDELAAIQCGESNGQDVYAQTRNVQAMAVGATGVQAWSEPLVVGERAAGEAAGALFAPQLLADQAGGLHAFWARAAGNGSGALSSATTPLVEAVEYAAWNGERWSGPVELLRQERINRMPAVAIGGDGRLAAAWSDREGEVLFSWADAARAVSATEWSEPMGLPVPRPAADFPTVAVGRDGVIYVAYAVPRNEERGVYLTRSEDRGRSWSRPALLFDAVAAGWEEVGAPQLALTGTNSLHVLWPRADERGSAGSSERSVLYYARSDDRGETWSAAAGVSPGDTTGGVVVLDHQLAGVGDQIVHRAWQEWDGSRLSLWHSYSVDNGLTWSRAARVGSLGDAGGPAALVVDSLGRSFLVQWLAGTSGAQAELRQWQWDAERWTQLEGSLLGEMAMTAADGLAAAVTEDSRLAVLLAAAVEDEGQRAVYVERSLPVPGVLPTPLPTLTPTPAVEGTPEPTALPEPTATAVFPTTPGEEVQLPFGLGAVQAQQGLVVGFALALGATVVVVTLGLIARRGAGRR